MNDALARLRTMQEADLPVHGGRTLAYVFDSGLEEVDRVLSEPESPAQASQTTGPVVLTDLTFTHPDRTVPALHDLSCVVPDVGVTAVTGPSGCGKSTLLAVLRERLAPEAVAWLPQRPAFLAGTVAENLRLSCPDATDEQLWAALR